MVLGHEGVAFTVDQLRARAAQGLGGEGRGVGPDVYGGRVELDEFGIGDGGARQGRGGQAFAAQLARVGGHRIEAAQAPGGEDHRRGDDFQQPALSLGQHPANPAALVLQEGVQANILADLHVRRGHGPGDHGLHDRPAGAVALDPGDAGVGMGGLKAEGEMAGLVAVEGGSSRHQAVYGGPPRGGDRVSDGGVHQARAGGNGVGGVDRGVILGAQSRGDAALSPGRAGAGKEGAGAEH